MSEPLKEDKLVVPAGTDTAKKKVSVELEVDTSVKDLGLTRMLNLYIWQEL